MIAELKAVGFHATTWQDAIGAVRASEKLTATGEIREGQLVRFTDDSGASLMIVTAEPFATWAGFAGTVQAFGSVTMLTDVVGLIDIIDDDDNVLTTLTALFAEGPLFADNDEELQRVILSVTVLASRAVVDSVERTSLVSIGAAQVGNGQVAPHAQISLSAQIATVELRTNITTGGTFYHLTVDAEWPLDVCLPADLLSEAPQPGQWLHCDGNAVAGLMAPPTCGGCSDGGCGNGCSTCSH